LKTLPTSKNQFLKIRPKKAYTICVTCCFLRQVMKVFASEMEKLAERLLELLCENLGLELAT
jgi:isopenicillin N synthase-like dioxygenase